MSEHITLVACTRRNLHVILPGDRRAFNDEAPNGEEIVSSCTYMEHEEGTMQEPFNQALLAIFNTDDVSEEDQATAVRAVKQYFKSLRSKKEEGDEYRPPVASLAICLTELLSIGQLHGETGKLDAEAVGAVLTADE